ncbi:Carboxylesterase A precursor [Arthrobacter saudimassiliensis]|uniref:Carboxylesterase A n=1 Tax=Arthrobacter saudimassiliensis TaxID=1461584 RepID=A0A078MK17_9MICC|nr:Carboxylesterase A precursor [Arthrobacter saudimassiliensis]
MTFYPRFRRRAAGAALAVALLASAGCAVAPAGSPGNAPRPGDPAAVGDVPDELRDYYTQDVDWTDCGEFRCATVEVPLSYDEPDGERIDLSVIMAEADGSPRGTILINPGGPGGSGYTTVEETLEQVTTDRLRGEYNILGFDPRGVGRSTPIECLTDEEMDEARAESFDPDTEEGLAAAQASAAELAAKCAENTGALLGHVDTGSAARDMDILRALAGDPELNYLGFSYGTFLGATYAELFPERVGRLVLDAGLDPAASNEEITLGQAAGFEQAIRTYVADCQTGSGCPLPGDVDDGVQTLADLFAKIEASPLTAGDGRTVTASMFVSGFILPLYNDANWPVLTQALSDALDGNPDLMLYLSDLSADRNEDGSYETNSTVAFNAINCLDYPMETDPEQMREDARELEKASPTLGSYLGYGGLTCAAWPHEPVGTPHEINAEGAAPILVVGTTGDPATPYEWSVALAEQLDSGVLLTWEGEGHTAYGRGSDCIADAVDDYFIDGTVPEDGMVCR